MPVKVGIDIETTGVGRPIFGSHFLQSSILEIGYTSSRGEASLAAEPASERMSTWSHETVWKKLRERQLKGLTGAMQSEQEILRRFLSHLQKLPDGSELIGWNLGYTPTVVGATDKLNFGYDLPGIATRAATYGMDKEVQKEFRRHTIRDIGQEFAVRTTRGIHRTLGGRGIKELVELGLLDPIIAKRNALQTTDDYLQLLLSEDVNLSKIFKDMTSEQKASITSSSSVKQIAEKMREVTGREDLSSGRKIIHKDLRRQAFGHYKQMISTERFAGRGVQATARAMAGQGIKFAGWAQETVQKSLMEFYGVNKENPLIQAFIKHTGVSFEQAAEVLGGKQAHLALEDARIALALSDVIDDNLDQIFKKDDDTLKFLGIWGKHAQRKKLKSSVTFAGFSGKALSQIFDPADGLDPLSGAFAGKEEFVSELAEEAQKQFGGTAEDWKVKIAGLGRDETLEYKFNLGKHRGRKVGDFPGFQKFKSKFGIRGDFLNQAFRRIGGKRIAAAAFGAGVIKSITPDIELLSGISDPGEEFKNNIDPYWKNILLGSRRISGKDDNFNSIQGLGHGEMSNELRRSLTDFGSGWRGNNGVALDLSDPDMALDPSMETRRRIKSMRKGDKISERDLLRFERAYQYEQDTSLSTFLLELADETPGKARMGSGWLLSTVGQYLQPGYASPDTMYGVNLDPRILEFRKNTLEDPDAYAAHQEEYKEAQRRGREQLGKLHRDELFEENLSNYRGISLHASNLRAVNLKDFTMEVEDADTLVLKRKGLMNKIDKPIYIRLAGIDAPEVGGHEHDPMAKWRINQSQPYGEQATNVLKNLVAQQEDLNLLVDPTQTTYGRHVGTLFGDEGVNLSLELLRQGAVSALPWGSRSGDIVDRSLANEAEAEAFRDELGMWRYTRYKATKQMGDVLGTRITHNTYTDLTKLAKNPDLAGFAGYLEMGPTQYRPLSGKERSAIAGVGTNLKRAGFSGIRRPVWQKGYNQGGVTYGLNPKPPASAYASYKLFQPSIPLTSNDEAYVNIEGLRHGGSASILRQKTDFGSGWKGHKNLSKKYFFSKTNDTYTSFVKHKSPVSDTSISSHIKRGTLDELSLEASAANRGIPKSDIPRQKISQAKNTPGEKLSHSDLTLASKTDVRYSEPARIRGVLDVPDFASKNSVSSKKYDEIKSLRRSVSSAAADRKNRFNYAHKKSVVLASKNGLNPGKRSKMGHGSDGFVGGI